MLACRLDSAYSDPAPYHPFSCFDPDFAFRSAYHHYYFHRRHLAGPLIIFAQDEDFHELCRRQDFSAEHFYNTLRLLHNFSDYNRYYQGHNKL